MPYKTIGYCPLLNTYCYGGKLPGIKMPYYSDEQDTNDDTYCALSLEDDTCAFVRLAEGMISLISPDGITVDAHINGDVDVRGGVYHLAE